MEFTSIDVSGSGPFAPGQVLKFHDGINLVCGPAGSGKTTICRELERLYRARFRRQDLPVALAVDLVFINERHYHEKRQTIVQAALALCDGQSIGAYPQLICHYVNRLIFPKILWGHTKFGNAEAGRFPFEVSVAPSGEFEIFDTKGRSCASLFSAAGESFLLSLACNLALRAVLRFFDPIVVDGVLNGLDEGILAGCHKEIVRTKSQCIYLVTSDELERLSSPTDYVITFDANHCAHVNSV